MDRKPTKADPRSFNLEVKPETLGQEYFRRTRPTLDYGSTAIHSASVLRATSFILIDEPSLLCETRSESTSRRPIYTGSLPLGAFALLRQECIRKCVCRYTKPKTIIKVRMYQIFTRSSDDPFQNTLACYIPGFSSVFFCTAGTLAASSHRPKSAANRSRRVRARWAR